MTIFEGKLVDEIAQIRIVARRQLGLEMAIEARARHAAQGA